MIDAFMRWWAAERRIQPAAGVTLLAICCAVLALGVPRLTVYGHDVFVSLDGGWRVLHGQRPQVDFFAQMGPVYYLLHAAGLALAGGAAEGLGYGSAIAAVVIGGWCFLVLRGRMASLPFALACVTLLLLAVAPFPLGHTPRQTAFAMKHNRYGFALTGLVLLECYLPLSASRGRRAEFGGGFSSGAACGLLHFLKISYGLVALVLVGVSLLFRPEERARIAGVAAGFAALVLPMLGYLRFDVAALVREYRMTAAAQGSHFSPLAIGNRLYLDRLELLPLFVLSVLTALLPGTPVRRGVVLVLVCLMAMGAGIMLALTNTQPYGVPLATVVTLLLINEWTLAFRARALPQAGVLLCVGLMAVASPVFLDASGLVLGLWDKALPPKPAYHFRAPHLKALSFVDWNQPINENDNGRAFVRYTEEGMDLVRAYGGPGESVRGMGMSNPFSYALPRPPSHGGAVNISTTNVSLTAAPPKEMLVGDVDLILLPKYEASERQTLAAVLARYPELLGGEYRMIAESADWKLYRKGGGGER